MQYSLYRTDEQSNITVFEDGQIFTASTLSHPNFESIVEGVENDDRSVFDLFDVSKAVAKRFERLTRRFSVANGRLYFDGDEVHNALASQVVRFLDEGLDDWKPLLAFAEKLAANPEQHSREQLFEWLDRYDFAITPSGDFIAYKGVTTDADGNYVSITAGPAIVDGQEQTGGRVPNYIGAVVEMSRSGVEHNPSRGCARGLHAGTFEYAQGFSQGIVLEVHIDPADVVSVPTDCNWQKIRTSRYVVVNTIKVPHASAYVQGFVDEVDGLDEDFDGEDDFDGDEAELW